MTSARLTPNSASNLSNNAFRIVLALWVTGIGLMTYFTPKLQEDLGFGLPNRDFMSGASNDINWSGIFDLFKYHYANTNGRLSDITVIVNRCLLSDPVSAILNACVFLLFFIGVERLSGIGRNSRPYLRFLALAIIMLWFPWNESMFLIAFSTNYLWTACLTVWFIYLFCNETRMCSHSPWVIALICLLAFICGTWHECVFMTLCAPLFYFLATTRNRKFRIRGGVVSGFMLLGFAVNAMTAGAHTRIDNFGIHFDYHNLFSIWHHIPLPKWQLWLSGIFILMYIIRVIDIFGRGHKRSFRGFIRMFAKPDSATFRFLTFTMLAVMTGVMLLGFFKFERALVISFMLSCCGIVTMVPEMNFRMPGAAEKISKAILFAITLLLCVNLYCNILFQRKVFNAFNQATEMWKNSESGIIYMDFPELQNHQPDYPWQMIITDMLTARWKQHFLIKFLDPGTPLKPFIIIPGDMQNVSTDAAACLNEYYGVYRTGGNLFSNNPLNMDFKPHIVDEYMQLQPAIIDVTTDKEEQFAIYANLIEFGRGGGAALLTYILPLNCDSEQVAAIKSVDNIEFLNR